METQICRYNRMKCLVFLTPSWSSLLCSQGLQANSSCFVLHTYMLIIREILLMTWGDKGYMYSLSKICRNLMTRLTTTSTIFSDPCWHPDVCVGQSSFAPPISPLKEAPTLHFLRIDLRYHYSAHLLGWCLFYP